MESSLLKAFVSLLVFLVSSVYAAANVRVEFELKDLNNGAGILQSGAKCSVLSKACSTKVTGYVDTASGPSGWPGSKKLDQWPEIVAEKRNSISLNKVMSGDFCSGGFTSGILRLHVVDTGMKDRLIEDFECSSGTTVAPTEAKSSWSPEQTCVAKYNPTNNRVTYRVRAYALPADSCGRPPARPKG